MTVRVYVAGASDELERAQRAIDFIRSIGWTITHDWVADVRRVRVEGGRADADLTSDEMRELAAADLAAVQGAELVWLLVPNTPSTGAWVELGYALALNRWTNAPRIIASGPRAAGSLWCSLLEQFETDEAAIRTLAGKAGN